MRIGVNTLFLVPGDVGGTEVYLRHTLAAMAAQMTGHTLVLFTNIENDCLLRDDLAQFSCVEFCQLHCRAAIRPLRILIEQFLLPLAVRKSSVDVLWSPGYTAPALCHVPQAVTIHDLQYKSHPEDMQLFERLAQDFLVRIACRNCTAVITISAFSKQEILRYGFAKEEKIYVIPEGVSDHFSADFSGNANEKDRELAGMGVRKPYLLCVAHTYPHKNVDKLVAAFYLFSQIFPHQLILVGNARRGEDKVIESLQKLETPGKVVRLSGLSEAELKVLYQDADIFILPSSYEGFGLPVLEAMASGTPVITTRMASLPELGGEDVVYVDTPSPDKMFQAMKKVMTLPPEQLLQHVTTARERARSFTWERTAALTLRMLRAVVDKSTDS